LSVQAMVRFSPTPETVMVAPAGGAEDVWLGAGRDTDGRVGGTPMLGIGRGEVLTRVVLGAGDPATTPASENRCAANAAIPPTRSRMPTTNIADTIQNTRLPEDEEVGAGYMPPYPPYPGVGGGGGPA
jgi:hypothetical protein